MSDFGGLLEREGSRGVLHPMANTPLGDLAMFDEGGYSDTAATWTANRAVYQPVRVGRAITVTDGLCRVQTQSGNLDIGLYRWDGTKLVSSGAIAVAAAGVQSVALADTVVLPGWYYIGFSASSATAVFRNSTSPAGKVRTCGVREQASAHVLPSPATFAVYATAVCPQVSLVYNAAA